ncbi:MAG: hypothetical protein KJO34_02750 [Deltaproteobacteria bacterium]|nr:hypothetical protein [Deltaproteobacteria bacterium]
MKIWLIGLLLVGCMPVTALAEVDARIVQTLKLDVTPLDIAIPSSGDYIYVLTSDAALKVFKPDGTLRDTLPVDPGVDRIKTGRREDQLFLLDTKNNRVRLLVLEFVHPIPIEGSPTKGPSQAVVTIAVFTDFQ